MKISKIILLIFGLSGCCSLCKKSDVATYLMDQNFKDYTLFPIGSYWIYAENISKADDSVYLYQQEVRINDSQKIHSYNYEQFNQSLGTTFFNDTLLGGAEAESYYDTIFFFYTERYSSNLSATNLQFFSKIAAGTSLDFADDSRIKYIGEFDSLVADGVEYRHERVFENSIQADDRLPQKIYYSKGIGVVRKELFNGQVWNLKRYFINR